jgi:autotransporter-associated beta strand protein
MSPFVLQLKSFLVRHPMSSSRVVRSSFLVLVSAVAGYSTTTAQAAEMNITWIGASNTNIRWLQAGNWTGGIKPGATENAKFDGAFTGTRQPDLSTTPQSINGIWMSGTPGKNVTITGSGAGVLTLTPTETINGNSGLGILVDNIDSSVLNLRVPIALGANQEWRNDTLISVNANNSATIISGSKDLTLRSTVNDLGSAFRFDGATSTYSFTGQLTVAEGALRAATANNVSTNGPLGNSAGAVILGDTSNKLGYFRLAADDFANDPTLAYSTNKPFILASGGRGGVWLNKDVAGMSLTISGKISGDGELVKLGASDDNSTTTLELTNSDNEWTGGTLITEGYVSVPAQNRLGDGTVTLDYQPQYIPNTQSHSGIAGLIFTGNTTLTSPGRKIVINSGIGDVGGIIDVTNSDSTLAGDGALSGAGAFTKAGTGSLTIAGDNSFAGTTTVSAGTLLVNGAQSGGATYTVDAGATLGGTGSVSAAVNINGTLAPGNSIESLAVGDLTFGSTSTFDYELDTSSLNGDLVVAGALNIDNAATLDLTELASGTVTPGDKLTLINYTGGGWDLGTFAGYADDSIFTLGSNMWQINYNDTTGGSNFSDDQTGSGFVTLTVVPEPTSAILIIAGAMVLVARVRGRRCGTSIG